MDKDYDAKNKKNDWNDIIKCIKFTDEPMKIVINDTLSIRDIQEKFSERYPFLKIEFFRKEHSKHTGSKKELMIPSDMLLQDCRSVHNKGNLEIHPSTTVMKLEQEFQESYGLSAQVFRKSGDVWIETTVTDDWTLAKQNEEAESFYNAVQEAKKTDRNQLLL